MKEGGRAPGAVSDFLPCPPGGRDGFAFGEPLRRWGQRMVQMAGRRLGGFLVPNPNRKVPGLVRTARESHLAPAKGKQGWGFMDAQGSWLVQGLKEVHSL